MYWIRGTPITDAGNGTLMDYWVRGVPASYITNQASGTSGLIGNAGATGEITSSQSVAIFFEPTGQAAGNITTIQDHVVSIQGDGLATGEIQVVQDQRSDVQSNGAATGRVYARVLDPNANEAFEAYWLYGSPFNDVGDDGSNMEYWVGGSPVTTIPFIPGNRANIDGDGRATGEITGVIGLISNITSDGHAEGSVSSVVGNRSGVEGAGSSTGEIAGALGTTSGLQSDGQASGEFTARTDTGPVVGFTSDGHSTGSISATTGNQTGLTSAGKSQGTITARLGIASGLQSDGRATGEIEAYSEEGPIILRMEPPMIPANGLTTNVRIVGEKFKSGCYATWTASPERSIPLRRIDENQVIVKIPGELVKPDSPPGVVRIYNKPGVFSESPSTLEPNAGWGGKTEQPVTRLGDSSTGHQSWPPRVNIQGSPTVFVNNKPWHRQTDKWAVHCNPIPLCHDGMLIKGAETVYVNSLQAGAIKDPISCGDKVATGSPNVFVGKRSPRIWKACHFPYKGNTNTWGDI